MIIQGYVYHKKGEKIKESATKEWFILFGNQQLGPFSAIDLKNDYRFNPDTLVWKKGYPEWIKARFIPELQELFKDEPDSSHIQTPDKKDILKGDRQQSQDVLTWEQDPNPYQFLLWILLLIFVFLYTFYRLYDL